MPSEYDFGGAGSFRGRERPTGRPRVGFILGHPGGLTDSCGQTTTRRAAGVVLNPRRVPFDPADSVNFPRKESTHP